MATASTRSQSSSAASDGVRSSATITNCPGSRDSDGASAAPRQVQLDAPQHVVEVGAALPQVRVAQPVEQLVELLGDGAQRPLRVHALRRARRPPRGRAAAGPPASAGGRRRCRRGGVRPPGDRRSLMALSCSREAATARVQRATSRSTASGGDEQAEDGHRLALHDEGGAHRDARRDPEPALPVSRLLAEAAVDEGGQRRHRRLLVLAVRGHGRARCPGRRPGAGCPGSTCRPWPARRAPR